MSSKYAKQKSSPLRISLIMAEWLWGTPMPKGTWRNSYFLYSVVKVHHSLAFLLPAIFFSHRYQLFQHFNIIIE